MFEIGEKVVCVDDKFDPNTTAQYAYLPTEGEIYTVRDTMPGLDHDQSVATGQKQVTMAILVEEIENPIPEGFHHEPAFAGRRFAPLEEQHELGVIEAEQPEYAEL